MIDLFKNIFWYIIDRTPLIVLCYMLKYVVGVQEEYDEVVLRKPNSFMSVSDCLKLQKNVQRGSVQLAKYDILCT